MNVQKPWYIKIWNEGKYLDFWSVNHVLAGGLLLGIFIYYLDTTLTFGFIVSLILMFAWEIFEYIFNIHETMWNKSTDIITGVIGFYGAYYLIEWNMVIKYNLFVTISIIFFVLEIWGFLAYKWEKDRESKNLNNTF